MGGAEMNKTRKTYTNKKSFRNPIESAKNLLPRPNHNTMPTKESLKKKTARPTDGTTKKPTLTHKEFYAVKYPYGYVRIQADKKTGKLRYLTIEPTMREEEKQILAKLKTILKEEANVPLSVLRDKTLMKDYFINQIKRFSRIWHPRHSYVRSEH
jgi:hypothetical protein